MFARQQLTFVFATTAIDAGRQGEAESPGTGIVIADHGLVLRSIIE